MLPFLDKKKTVSVIMSKRGKPDMEISPEVEAPDSKIDPQWKTIAEDMLRAVESKSPIDLAHSLQDAFDYMENHEEPQDEMPENEEGE